jgi:mono/diheme cytochrome c family protein
MIIKPPAQLKSRFWVCLGSVMFCLSAPVFAQATSAAAQSGRWAQVSKTTNADFTSSAERGKAFFLKANTVNKDFPNCAACHTANPAAQGKHAVTGKAIAPLAPSANAERFTDAGKTDKWFKRNCNDVLGRECTAPEKADFITYLIGVK